MRVEQGQVEQQCTIRVYPDMEIMVMVMAINLTDKERKAMIEYLKTL